MNFLLSLMTSYPYVDPPYHTVGWVIWVLFLIVLIGMTYRWRDPDADDRGWKTFLTIVFVVITPLTTLFVGLEFSDAQLLPFPGLPLDLQRPVLMLLSAIPWILAGGLLGPVPAVLIGFTCGLSSALWETHSMFTLLEIPTMALLFSYSVRQRYRTNLFKVLRHPLLASILIALGFSLIFFINAILETAGGIAVRIDFAISQIVPMSLVNLAEMMIAGMLAELMYIFKYKNWVSHKRLLPTPSEASLPTRFLNGTLILVGVTLVGLFLGDWLVAGKASKKMLEENLYSASQVAAESLPYFHESGQNLLLSLADETILNGTQENIELSLENKLRQVPFFNQLRVFDRDGKLVAAYPKLETEPEIVLTEVEKAGVTYALNGVLIQTYTVTPKENSKSAEIIFLAQILNQFHQPVGVLVGTTDMLSNPITQPIVKALNSVENIDGEAIIVDEDWQIVYHSNPEMVMSQYFGQNLKEQVLSEEVSTLGLRHYVYMYSVIGRPWKVILTVPPKQAQELTIMITGPLMIILVVLALLISFFLWKFIRNLTVTLQTISEGTTMIATGDLNHSLQIDEVNELGRFADAFEQMRISLKTRMDELNSLVMVSQGVASHLESDQMMLPILRAALKGDVTLARIMIIEQDILGEANEKVQVYELGQNCDEYAYLDSQIFSLMEEHDMLAIPNTIRLRRIDFKPEARPGALLAFNLQDENEYLGAFWVVYDEPHNFTDEEIQFYKALAVQSSMAATNSRLYREAEIGRQRLLSVLDSAPEPVMVFDENMRLQILNPAALQIKDLVVNYRTGTMIDNALGSIELIKFLNQPFDEKLASREITLPDGKVYFVSASQVRTNGYMLGKVCILRDVSNYKELDALKTDFVATVSHDLRSPLTLLQGYATMLELVGTLNDQQEGYVVKMVNNIQNMIKLVNNLLDLGRIETGVGLELSEVSIAEEVEEVASSLKPQAGQKEITFEFGALLRSDVKIEADAELVRRAFYNLVENAIKYSSIGGNVSGQIRAGESSVVIEIKDEGIGIAPLDLPHMYEKFYRSGNKEAHAQRGTGLGLAIVKSIAERHHGRVWVESQLGKGSTFFVEFPYEQEKED